MTESGNIYGKKSYEFAVGRIKAGERLLSAEQWSRLRAAPRADAEKLLTEYGYSSDSDAELNRTVDFLKEISPDADLTELLFFEEDALNLKLYLKARLIGAQADTLPVCTGGIEPDLLRICVYTEDYSLLGSDAEAALDGISSETNPQVISCRVDSAMFLRALRLAEKKHCKPLVHFLQEYGAGKNRLTALRILRLGGDPAFCREDCFLPVEWSAYAVSDRDKSEAEIAAEIKRRREVLLEELGYDMGMGPIVQYYFRKKGEAASLRLLLAEKSLAAVGGAAVNG